MKSVCDKEGCDCTKRFPEHEKLKMVSAESQGIGVFLDWLLEQKGVVLCKWEGHYPDPIRESPEQLLAQYFDIDLKKLEAEKQEMLSELRTDRGGMG